MKKQIFYIASIGFLIIGFGIFGFILFLVPYIFFGFQYDIPTFIAYLSVWLRDNYGIVHHTAQAAILLLPLFIAGAIFIYLAWLFGTFYEERELASELKRDKEPFRVRPLPKDAPVIRSEDADFVQRHADVTIAQSKRSRIPPLVLHLSLIAIVLILLVLLEWWMVRGF